MNKKLICTLVVVGGIIIMVLTSILISFNTSNKYVCTSDQGKITIMYKKDKIIGYAANGYSYDLDKQKKYAEQIGLEEYLEEFNNWFVSNSTNGKCEKK